MIRGPKSQDICYATENRQMAVKGVSEFCELILVVGSANSSNSKRLVEVGQNYGVQAYLVNDWSDVHPEWLEGITSIGVTAGASAPEHLVEQIVAALGRKRIPATGRSGNGGRRRALFAASGIGQRRLFAALRHCGFTA